ncbi:MAG: YDG domain-containing protein, partial [Sphaerochaeta sp.]|nr:YDG domain-containing protein [Sphaerochaeta sp.]
MKKTKPTRLLLLFILITAAIFFTGCSDMMEKLGSISLTIVLDTPNVVVASYVLEAEHVDTSSRFSMRDIIPPRHSLSALKKGTWDLTVTAYDANSVQLGRGTTRIDLKEGQILETTLLVVFTQAVPPSSGFTLAAPSRFDSADGQVNGTTTAMEYRLSSSPEDTPYTPCTQGATILGPGTYLVRYAAAHALHASEPLAITIPAYEPIQLTIGSPTLTASKIYDGTTAVEGTVSAGSLIGIRNSDEVRVSAQATYDTEAAGTGKQITVTYTLTGPDAPNYLTPVNTTVAASIAKKQLTVSETAILTSKVYDGTTFATLTSQGILTGVVAGDSVSSQATATYTTKDAGTAKRISLSYTLDGTDKDNYLAPVGSIATETGVIMHKQLSVSNLALAASKVYDGTTSAATPTFSLVGKVPSDDITVAATATYASADADSNNPITIIYSLSGAEKDNYLKPADDASTIGEIAKKQLIVSGTDLVTSKVYDSTTTASISRVTFTGKVADEDVTVGATSSYARADADSNNPITIIYSLSGADKDNYLKPADDASTIGEIAKKQLSVSGTDLVTSKVYDGTTSATISSVTFTGKIADEDVTVGASASYGSPDAGSGNAIQTRYSLSGTDKANYLEPNNSLVAGTILKKPLTMEGTIVDTTKAYDGLVAAKITSKGLLNGVISGDAVTAEVSATYEDKTAGSGKTITIGYTLSGADSGNYLKPVDKTEAGLINKRPLIVSGTTVKPEKPYDGLSAAKVESHGTLSGFVSDDSLAVQAIATYDTKHAGTDKPITVTYTLIGTDKDNYITPGNATISQAGVITPKQLGFMITESTNNKVYDGTTVATAPTFSTFGKVGSDDVRLTATAAYDTPIAENYKQISVFFSLEGADKDNYLKPSDLRSQPVCSILKKQLTISAPTLESDTKTYDGTIAVHGTVTVGTLSGVLEGEVVTVEATAQYGSADVTYGYNGNLFNQITIKYTLDGTNAGNYDPPVEALRWGSIEPKPLTVIDTLFPASRVYDGTRTVPISSEGTLSGVIAGDSVSLDSVLAIYNTKDAGNDKAVDIRYEISGADTFNYTLVNDTSRKASITPAFLTATVGDYTQQYGSAVPTFLVNVTGFVAGESTATASWYSPPVATSGTTSTPDAGTYTLTLTGGSARNYSFDISDTGTLTIEKAMISGTVSIGGNALTGQVLTANISLTNAGTPTYQWKRNGTAINGANGTTYMLAASDVGTSITVTVTAGGTNYQGSITSSPLGPIQKPLGPSMSDTLVGYYPASPASPSIINLTGFSTN